MFVATKLLALALISSVSMTNVWKWPVAFSVGMAVLVGVCQPYMWPQAGPTETRFKSVAQRIGQSCGEFQRISQRNVNFDLLSRTLPKLFVTCPDSTSCQVNQLQAFSYLCLALTSVAFIYDWPWLARVALMAPVIMLFWQAREGMGDLTTMCYGFSRPQKG